MKNSLNEKIRQASKGENEVEDMSGVKVTVENGTMTREEIDKYIDYLQKKSNGNTIDTLNLKICDDDYVEMSYTYKPVPFERIRRITGYLVGTLDRFNDAKRAEESDRVKHMNLER